MSNQSEARAFQIVVIAIALMVFFSAVFWILEDMGLVQ